MWRTASQPANIPVRNHATITRGDKDIFRHNDSNGPSCLYPSVIEHVCSGNANGYDLSFHWRLALRGTARHKCDLKFVAQPTLPWWNLDGQTQRHSAQRINHEFIMLKIKIFGRNIFR